MNYDMVNSISFALSQLSLVRHGSYTKGFQLTIADNVILIIMALTRNGCYPIMLGHVNVVLPCSYESPNSCTNECMNHSIYIQTS